MINLAPDILAVGEVDNREDAVAGAARLRPDLPAQGRADPPASP